MYYWENVPGEIRDKIAKKLEEWVKHKEVVAVFLFGSWAKGTAKENSDIDIAIILNPYNEDLDVDLSLEHELDVVVLNKTKNPILVHEALIKGKPIFIRDKKAFYEKAFELLRIFWRSAPLLRRFGVLRDEV